LQEEFWEEFNRGESTRAREKVEQMGRLAPTSVEYQESLTRWLVRNRDYQEARTALQTCLQLFPKSQSCLLDRADVELSIGDTDSQLHAIQRCLEVWPNHPLCLNDLAIANMHRGQYEAAVEIYQRLPSLNGRYGIRIGQELLQSQLGYALEGSGRIREAWEEFDRACRSNFSDSCSKADDLKAKL
jgi:tetratricopeptide (TPR) repeat protein